jgi:hypothetical protein
MALSKYSTTTGYRDMNKTLTEPNKKNWHELCSSFQ